ncbi:MAG: hypothetical protein MUO97_06885 [Dehalococcoidia bacterium]|nr:hypothetical protein [Dehalococcoidia bacterium]
MQNNRDLLPTMAVFIALAAVSWGWGGIKMVGISPLVFQIVATVCMLFAFVIALFIFVENIRNIFGRRKGKTGYNKSPDSQNIDHKDKQFSISIGINSGDFTDDKMSTKRMNDFHKLVESISRKSNSHNKQSSTEGIPKKTRGE